MVERQIVARGVKDTAVLRAMRQVPRHLFVPVSYAPQAYWDGPLPIGHGRSGQASSLVLLIHPDP